MEREFLLKMRNNHYIMICIFIFFSFFGLQFILPFLNFIFIIFFSKFIGFYNYFLIFCIVLILFYIFLIYFIIIKKIIPYFQNENKITLDNKKIIFFENFKEETENWIHFDSKKIILKFSDILKISENYEKDNFKIYFYDSLYLELYNNLNEEEKIKEKEKMELYWKRFKIFSKKDFKKEEEYFEFLDFLKRKSRK